MRNPFEVFAFRDEDLLKFETGEAFLDDSVKRSVEEVRKMHQTSLQTRNGDDLHDWMGKIMTGVVDPRVQPELSAGCVVYAKVCMYMVASGAAFEPTLQALLAWEKKKLSKEIEELNMMFKLAKDVLADIHQGQKSQSTVQ